jgi:hypothetical protein
MVSACFLSLFFFFFFDTFPPAPPLTFEPSELRWLERAERKLACEMQR